MNNNYFITQECRPIKCPNEKLKECVQIVDTLLLEDTNSEKFVSYIMFMR
jgi:hypothetical protein